MTKLLKILFIACIILISKNVYSQESRSMEKRKKELIEKEEQRKAEEAQALKEMQAGHIAIQSKDTKKRMKKSKKKANKVNQNKRPSLFRRIFTK